MKLFLSVLTVFFIVFHVIACHVGDNKYENNIVGTGSVTFINLSSYSVIVRRDSFSGIIVAELGSGTNISKTVDVQANTAHGLGTTFEIEYIVTPIDGTLQMTSDGGTITASAFDSDIRFRGVMIEENSHITLQIPQPQNLYVRSAFITIQNNNPMPATLVSLSPVLQAGSNRLIPIAPFRTGIYRINDLAFLDIPIGGTTEFSGLTIRVGENSFPLPVFIARNGFRYCFIFDGNSVTMFCRGVNQPPCAGHAFIF